MEFKKSVEFGKCFKKVSKKGNEYFVVALYDDSQAFQCLSDVEVNGAPGKIFTGVFDLNLQYKSLKLKSVVIDGK